LSLSKETDQALVPALAIEAISKRFGTTQALEDVSFSIAEGEICAIVGENGAGKSSLMNILAGAFPQDGGRIAIRGRNVTFRSPQDAQQSGIGIVHQELNLVETLTVLENLFIGRLLLRAGIVDWPGMRAKAHAILALVGAESVPLDIRVDRLSIGQQQLIEIARTLSTDPAILILDEPTSSLSERDSERLLALVRALKMRGHTILYISHRMHEVEAIADTVVVLRDGRFVWKRLKAEAAEASIAEAMVGREVNRIHRQPRVKTGQGTIELHGVDSDEGLRDISLAVHGGEIVGLAGLIGAGRTEVAHAMFGLARVTKGKILLSGKPIRIRSPREALAHGICLVPEDRKTEGLNLESSIAENTVISFRSAIARSPFLQPRREAALAERLFSQLHINAPGVKSPVRSLSGGNQQKVVLAKSLAMKPRVLIFDEPTRGVDIAAKAEIHKLIIAAAEEGVAVVLISSELPELLAIADRVVVMANRRVRGELPRDASEADVMMHALAN
jgi:ABC-type sugar transport system ATPase subunit